MTNVKQKIVTGKKLWNLWRIDAATRRFMDYNERRWNAWRVPSPSSSFGEAQPEVLCNLDPICLGHVKFSYLMNVLARQHQAVIKTFSTRPAATQRRFYGVYQSFNTQDYIFVAPLSPEHPRVREIVEKIWPQVINKQALFDLKINDIEIGVDIYETYLRKCEQPTVDLYDPRLFQLLSETVGLILFWQDYFATHNVRALGMSIDGYTANNTVTKVAQTAGVPVYTPDIVAPRIRDVPFAASAAFPHYRELFAGLPLAEQTFGLARAKEQLERRLQGEVGVNMSYSTKSAWHHDFGPRVVAPSSRTKVLICSHDFVDAPHSHGGLLFVDFVEWLLFVADAARETNYDWYIKLHADHDPASAAVVKEIVAAFPNLTIVPPSTSHHQLIHEGINAVLTCYGSVGHEYPLFGIPVVNAGYNPHIAYAFNYHARSREEYRDYLLRLSTFISTVNLRDVYEFYYIHHYDDLAPSALPWWQEFVSVYDSATKAEPGIYDRWQETITDERHAAIITQMQRAVRQRVHHLAEVSIV